MKANELMLGDLLRFKKVEGVPDKYIAVHAIKFDYNFSKKYLLDIVFCDNGNVQYNYNPSIVEPIPLTPEILEKNGFKKDNDEVWPYYVFVADIEKCPQTIITFSFYGKGVSVETLFRCWTKPKCCDGENNIHICDLKYVHELQHALRLCGIDKEIVL